MSQIRILPKLLMLKIKPILAVPGYQHVRSPNFPAKSEEILSSAVMTVRFEKRLNNSTLFHQNSEAGVVWIVKTCENWSLHNFVQNYCSTCTMANRRYLAALWNLDSSKSNPMQLNV